MRAPTLRLQARPKKAKVGALLALRPAKLTYSDCPVPTLRTSAYALPVTTKEDFQSFSTEPETSTGTLTRRGLIKTAGIAGAAVALGSLAHGEELAPPASSASMIGVPFERHEKVRLESSESVAEAVACARSSWRFRASS
jgi:hypothetical protein